MPTTVVVLVMDVPSTETTESVSPVGTVSFASTLPVAVAVPPTVTEATAGVAVGGPPVTSTVSVEPIVNGELTVVVVFTMLPVVAT